MKKTKTLRLSWAAGWLVALFLLQMLGASVCSAGVFDGIPPGVFPVVPRPGYPGQDIILDPYGHPILIDRRDGTWRPANLDSSLVYSEVQANAILRHIYGDYRDGLVNRSPITITPTPEFLLPVTEDGTLVGGALVEGYKQVTTWLWNTLTQSGYRNEYPAVPELSLGLSALSGIGLLVPLWRARRRK